MAEIFKNFTDNPWFWATVALSGLMLINHLVTKVNTAIKTMEKFSAKKQDGIKTEKNIKENKKAGK